MVNIAIVGCNGKMGCFVAQAVQSREDCNVLFGVDAFGESNYDFDVFKTFDEATETPDVIIDFSNPAALDGMLSYAVDTKYLVLSAQQAFLKIRLQKSKMRQRQFLFSIQVICHSASIFLLSFQKRQQKFSETSSILKSLKSIIISSLTLRAEQLS